MHRLGEEAGETRMKGEMFDRDDRLAIPGYQGPRRIDAKVSSGNFKSSE
jgi:hypothetical protein